MSKCNLKEEMNLIINEIQRYKWIESEKAGHDIGENQAAFEWIEKYYDSWKQWWLSNNESGC